MKVECKIRKANEDDLDEINLLWLKMVKELTEYHNPNLEWWKNIARDSLKSGTYTILIALVNSKIVGFIDWFYFPEPLTGKIHAVGQHFFVHPAYRKTSVGYLLYKNGLKMVKEKNIKVLDLFSSIKDNKWNKIGYIPIRKIMRRIL